MNRILACLLGAALAAPAFGQNLPLTFKVTVKPAVPPAAALQYTLVPQLKDMTAGNALTRYYKAFSLEWWGNIQRQNFAWHEAADKALDAPLDRMPPEYAFVKDWKMLHEIDRGARMDHCDWEMLTRLREDGFAVMLPDVQSMRTVAKFLALRARYQMAAGDVDKALYTLQTGFGYARHQGEGPSLIHMLVGVAVSQILCKQLDELIQHPKCPNLYWALSNIPRPYVNIHRAIQAEMMTTNTVLPEFDELRQEPVSVDRAQKIMDDFVRRARHWGVDLTPKDLTVYALAAYAPAKQALTLKGRARAEVEAMPVPQVLLLHSMEEFVRLRDDLFKWVPLPQSEAHAGIKQADAAILAARTRGDILPAFLELLPAVENSRNAAIRADRRFAMLRVVEAVRLYAARNDGKLPARLEDVTEVPIPLDPMSGKPFEYGVKDGTASILGPVPAGGAPHHGMLYQVTIKK